MMYDYTRLSASNRCPLLWKGRLSASGNANRLRNMDTAQRYGLTALKVVLLTAAIFYLAFILRSSFSIRGELYFTLIDDAMVSMRYAQHLAQGFGMVWNIGEKPVEGFTNPGWMLFMALLHLFAIPASKASFAVMIAAAIFLLVNALAVYKICAALQPQAKYAPLIAAAVTAFYFPLVFWSLRGMEVGLLTLLISLGILTALQLTSTGVWHSSVALSLILFLALLIRLDTILQISLIVIYVAVQSKFDLHAIGFPLLTVSLSLLAILWFQHAYFGDFLPNTYYQKVVGVPAWERIRNGILVFTQYATRDTLMLVVFSVAGMILYADLRNRNILLLAALFIVQCAYSIWVGGDYAEVEVDAANRFITQGIPTLIIVFSLAAERVISDLLTLRRPAIQSKPAAQSAVALGVAFAVLLVISGEPWINWTINNAPLLKADIRRVKLGLAIAAYTSPEATIAVHAAGQIPYYSDRRTIDLLGLNDPVIAKGPVTGPFYPGHDKWNYDYSILQLKPDLIADNWIRLGDFMKDNAEYRQLDNGIYIRKDSTLLNVDGLSKEYR